MIAALDRLALLVVDEFLLVPHFHALRLGAFAPLAIDRLPHTLITPSRREIAWCLSLASRTSRLGSEAGNKWTLYSALVCARI